MADKKLFTSADEKEIIQALETMVLRRLIELSNKYENYQRAIDEVTVGLRRMVVQVGVEKKQMIEDAANRAGAIFLKKVDDTKFLEEVKRKHFRREILEGRFPLSPVLNSGAHNDGHK